MPRGMSARPSAQHSAVRTNARVEVRTGKDLVSDLQVARRTDRPLEREPTTPRKREGARAPSPGAARLEVAADQEARARVEDVSDREPSQTGI
jgi:hypothetical protein